MNLPFAWQRIEVKRVEIFGVCLKQLCASHGNGRKGVPDAKQKRAVIVFVSWAGGACADSRRGRNRRLAAAAVGMIDHFRARP